ncbi:MAG: allantoinase PuuE [Pelagibacteraceae bacterium]|nr:allantoinase PuuE [Pelagibacteraceae bacterium]MBO6467015.1 allantoinase PuuE [Pelagibacteraceae bacterium]MBO6467650.1 allantoinase PuuE [Pelagibacteraceae bacterium]MBO6470429.1 allantoinase PuuE [Pelagibacteraceae bacterium]MBO6470855.1 allantoinase PuuE [Pelagibacteraceae bacterium]
MYTMNNPRNFLGYGKNDFKIVWPNNAKLALQFVLNYEEGGENCVLNGDQHSETFLSEIIGAQPVDGRHMNMESIYEYGSRRGFWRIYNNFIERKLPLTIFGVGLALQQNNEICSAIKDSNFEVASHGYRWIDYQFVDEKIEKDHILKSYNIIKEIFGSYPKGWYAGRTSPNTRRLVIENTDVIYDSDSYSDDLPYWEKVGDKKHLIVPYTLDNNDMRFATNQGFNSGEQFFQYLKDSFDCLYKEGEHKPKMMSVGLHCRLIGRPGRMQSLLKFLDYIQNFKDVWICRRDEIADHWYKNYQ